MTGTSSVVACQDLPVLHQLLTFRLECFTQLTLTTVDFKTALCIANEQGELAHSPTENCMWIGPVPD